MNQDPDLEKLAYQLLLMVVLLGFIMGSIIVNGVYLSHYMAGTMSWH